jgi:hypothetical protein
VRIDRPLRRWVAALAACLAARTAAAASPPLELEVKATYLAKFAPFVIWPQTAFASPGAPLVLCVQGDDPFGRMLDRVTQGQNVGAHPMVVRRMARVAPDSGCQIAYLAGSPAQSEAEAVRVLTGQPVLTVTDADGDADSNGKGIVRLVLIDGRVRFMIDAGRAGQSGLLISSKLLALAADVKR